VEDLDNRILINSKYVNNKFIFFIKLIACINKEIKERDKNYSKFNFFIIFLYYILFFKIMNWNRQKYR